MDDSLALLIVAEDPLARVGLAALMGTLPECEIVGQMAEADLTNPANDEWLEEAALVLWDWSRDEASEDLLDLVSELSPVVALVSDSEQAVTALTAGCRGVVQRNREQGLLLAVLQVVAGGLVVVPDDLLPDGPGTLNPDQGELLEDLTPRELEVLHLVAEGLTNRAIAQQMLISEHTVKFHLNAIMSKLSAQSRTEAVVRATRLGLISL